MIVIFDLDETLGYFLQFSIFYDCLNEYLITNYNYKLTQEDFVELFDLYPEFLRPNILTILNYLKYEKLKKKCKQIMIYTNNQGPEYWVNNLVFYFEYKLKFKLFDKIIYAYKINGVQIELERTTHEKNINDLIKCSKININSKIFFLDDSYYSKMFCDNVYYLNIKPYIYNLRVELMINKFNNSDFNLKFDKSINISQCIMKKMHKLINNYKTKNDYEIDKIISKQIMYHLQTFLKNK